jgi:hypothetical protein
MDQGGGAGGGEVAAAGGAGEVVVGISAHSRGRLPVWISGTSRSPATSRWPRSMHVTGLAGRSGVRRGLCGREPGHGDDQASPARPAAAAHPGRAVGRAGDGPGHGPGRDHEGCQSKPSGQHGPTTSVLPLHAPVGKATVTGPSGPGVSLAAMTGSPLIGQPAVTAWARGRHAPERQRQNSWGFC